MLANNLLEVGFKYTVGFGEVAVVISYSGFFIFQNHLLSFSSQKNISYFIIFTKNIFL